MGKPQRLDKTISACGYLSRSEAKVFARTGKITVNGAVERDVSRKVNPETDVISVDGNIISYKKHVWLVMNKPSGYLSAMKDSRSKTVFDLLEPPYTRMDLFVAGRLDKDTTGMLILTNDGKSAHEMISPKKHVPKKYFATVSGKLDGSDVKEFELGIELSDFRCKPAVMEIVDSGVVSKAYVTITEGKYHQIKRMFSRLGKEVIALKRVKIGALTLPEELSEGNYRELSEEEIFKLLNNSPV